MLLTAFLQPYLLRVPAAAGLPLSLALFALCYNVPRRLFGLWELPAAPYRNGFTACFGFPPPDFFSVDYFPLLPWLFLFWGGFYLYGAIRPPRVLAETRLPAISALGRRSLWVYLLHQPVVYALLSLWNWRAP